MANRRSMFVLLLQIILFNNIYCADVDIEVLNEYYRPQIHSLVRHLNQDINRIYKYNYATLVNAQNKDDDKIELIIDVETECLVPDLCTTDKLTCTGTVQYNTETQAYETLRGVSCHPKVKVDLRKDDEEAITKTTEIEDDRPRIEISHDVEGVSDYAPPQPQPKMVYCLGCPVDINTNIDGIDTLADVAVKHIESERDNKLVILKILGVQRQVVAGVKYTITLEIGSTFCPKTVEKEYLESCVTDTNSPSEICQITYFQQPWISRNKHIIANNCTHSQQFIEEVQTPTTEKNDMENDIDSFFNQKNQDMGGIMSPIHMREIESQIVFKKPVENQETTTTESNLSDSQRAAIEDFLDMMGDQPRQKRSTNNDNNDDSSSSSSSSSEDNDDNNDDNNDDDNHDNKKSKLKHKKDCKNDNDIHDDDDDDNGNGSSSSSSSSSEENNGNDNTIKKRKTRNKREVTDQSNSSESDEKEKKAGVKDDNTSEDSSEELKKDDETITTTTTDELTDYEMIIQTTTDNILADDESDNEARKRRSLLYNEKISKISADEKNFVKNLVTFAINELDDIDNDERKRIVLQVLSAKKMYDNGYVYHIMARVGTSKCQEDSNVSLDLNKKYPQDECILKLHEDLTKICKLQVHVNVDKEEPKVLKSHCQNAKQEILSRMHRTKRQIAGGVTEVDPKSEKIQKLAKHVLQQIDVKKGYTESQEIDEILFASSQVVSGMLYKLKIRVKHGGTTKVCDYSVWEQLWMPIKHQVTEHCDNEKNKYKFKRSLTHHLLGKDGHDIHIGLFKKFMIKHKKIYKDKEEFRRRFKIFRENMKKVQVLNINEQGTAKYGPTMFADMTDKEFAMYKGLKPELRKENSVPFPNAVIPDIDIPVEFDWRKKGVISEVKNQGQCGSCWAFSVTGNIEGLNAIKTGEMIELSEQELVDCDTSDNGCGGGLMDNAYRAIEKLGGLETERDYPYEAENEKCHLNKTMTRVQISGAVNISSNELDMAKWLVQNGPISIGINANAMQFYMGGISHPFKFLCKNTSIDHGVLLVGYGVHKYPMFNKTMPYWIVKNSWGELWGEQGYYRVYRGDGTCGVNTMPESAIL